MLKNKTNKLLFILFFALNLSACVGTPVADSDPVLNSSDTQAYAINCHNDESEFVPCVVDEDGYEGSDDSRTAELVGAAILQGVVHGVIEVLVHALVYH